MGQNPKAQMLAFHLKNRCLIWLKLVFMSSSEAIYVAEEGMQEQQEME